MSQTKETLKSKSYTYNSKDKKFVFHTETSLGKNYVLDESKVDTILKLYSNFDKQPYTAGEIAQRTSTPKKVIEFVVRSLKVNHGSIPYTDEKIEESKEDELVEDLLIEKRANIEQKFERRDWKDTIADAENWRKIESGVLNPIKDFIESFNVSSIKTQKTHKVFKVSENRVAIYGISDTHFGNIHPINNSYNQPVYTLETIKTTFDNYLIQIQENLNSRTDSIEKAIIVFGGDILHSLNSFTSRGTQLQDGVWGIDQYKIAFETLVNFISSMKTMFKSVEIKAASSNHDMLGDWILLYSLSQLFTDIDFQIATNRWIDFNVGGNLFILEHGASGRVRGGSIPDSGNARESFIQNLFINASHKYTKIDRWILLCGDRHTIQYGEYNNFEFFRFSTPVKGDSYADTLNLKNRPRFNSFIVDESGIKEIINYYM